MMTQERDDSQDFRISKTEHEISEINHKLDRILSYIDTDQRTGRPGLFDTIGKLKKDIADIKVRIAELETLNKIELAKKVVKNSGWLMLGSFLTFVLSQFDEIVRWLKHIAKIY